MRNIFISMLSLFLLVTSCSAPADSVSYPSEVSKFEPSEEKEETFTKTEEERYFVKALSANKNPDYTRGVLALDNLGTLYFYNSSSEDFELVMEDVKDFSRGNYNWYVLKNDGLLISTGHSGYKDNVSFVNEAFYPDAQFVSDTMLMLSDGRVVSYYSGSNAWRELDISAKKIDADQQSAAILDTDGTLWYVKRSREASKDEFTKVAEDVTDFSYTEWNKAYYHSDLWYVTENGKPHLVNLDCPEIRTESYLPEQAEAIWGSGESGHYIARKYDGIYLTGNADKEGYTVIDGVKGGTAALWGTMYTIVDESGILYYGKIDEKINIVTLKHPQ